MGAMINLTGRRFGKLTVIEQTKSRKPGRPMWLCQCDCGNIAVVSSTGLMKHRHSNPYGHCKCTRNNAF